MEEAVLLSALDEGVLTLTLNRPDRMNAMNWQMMRLLLTALTDASVDPGVRCVVLQGAGRAFCSGGDMRGKLDRQDPISEAWYKDPVWNSMPQRTSQLARYTDISVLLHRMPKPTIASIRGGVAGAGLSMAAACDFRIFSEKSAVSTAFVNVARSGDFGGSYFLTKLLGVAKARELYMLGEKLTGTQAHAIGLATRLVADEELEAATLEFARRLAQGPTVAYRFIKQNLNTAETAPLEQVLELEGTNMMLSGETEDGREVGLAMQEGRKPVFRGR